MDTNQLILEELRAFRAAVMAWQQETGERVSSLETSMYSLVGNGQPGRMAKAEDAISELNKWRWRIVGISSGITSAIVCLGWVVERMVR